MCQHTVTATDGKVLVRLNFCEHHNNERVSNKQFTFPIKHSHRVQEQILPNPADIIGTGIALATTAAKKKEVKG